MRSRGAEEYEEVSCKSPLLLNSSALGSDL
jgi:hypothetical protein